MIFDSGGVIALSRGDRRARNVLAAALLEGADIILPPIVLTQTLRGGTRDAAVHQVLRMGFVTFVGSRLARRAGELLGASGLEDAADAQIMAEALRVTPSVVLTSDAGDMRALAGDAADVRLVAI